MHDASHSKQILINIERLLGEESISLLSATDIWLLLESAYWHDIGMVVPHADQLTAEQSSGFSDLVENIKLDPAHDLYKFCNQLDFTLPKPWLKIDLPIADFLQRYSELMAEFFRSKHASRSSDIVLNPIDSIGLQSPRNTLIPSRLFATLSQICLLHGSDFYEIEARLPHKINGVGNDDCHPRFIACMLRLGDLLDIDDNRFCPTLQLMYGEGRPELSKTHEKKHASIQDFSISPLEIKIRAICGDVDTYYETYQWFAWLEEEHKQQLLNWSSISPDEKRITLPSRCSATVKISGDQIILNAGRKQEFSIDGHEALYLLGESLYSDPLLCMREIIQNAIDATAIRAWIGLEDKEFYRKRDNFPIVYQRYNSEELQKYPITITVNNNNGLEITVQDQGTGISRDDIHYLLNVATSKNNKIKKSVIKDMPSWMRPSGNFGVGFQSIFNITDNVEIITKCFYTNKRTKIEAFDPRGSKRGKVIVTDLAAAYDKHSGTTVKFTVTPGVISKIGTITKFRTETEFDEARNDFLSKARSGLAPLKDNADTDKHLRIAADLIGRNHEIASNLHFQLLDHNEIRSTAFSGTPFSPKPEQFFEITITPRLLRPFVFIRYRGAPVQELALKNMLFSVDINILCGSAREWVTPSRNQLKQEKFEILDEVIVNFIKENPDQIFTFAEKSSKHQDSRTQIASLTLDHLSLSENLDLNKLLPEKRDAYLKYKIEANGEKIEIENLLKTEDLVLTDMVGLDFKHLDEILPKTKLKFSPNTPDREIGHYIQNKLLKVGFYARRYFFNNKDLIGSTLLYFKKEQDTQELESHLSDTLVSNLTHISKGRTLFACIAVSSDDDDFKNLTLSRINHQKDDLVRQIPLLNIVDLELYKNEPVKWVVLPYIFRRGLKTTGAESIDTEDCYRLAEVMKNFLDNQTLSIAELASCYQKLIEVIDDRMLESPHKNDWSKLRAKHQS
nr:ATP-binding protein [Marinagarivorans cellulosilyticus]